MKTSNRCITGIAEISLRVHNLDIMRKFYEEVLGLEIMQEFDGHSGRCLFYALGDGDQWDGQKMALFSEKLRLEQLGIEILRSGAERWMQARMFYFADPEGNIIECRSYDRIETKHD